jgi:arylsulfatase A-like enzyme
MLRNCRSALRALIFSTTTVVLLASGPPALAAPRPNIVLILVDDLGWSDIAPFGGEISTPNLSALAAAGTRMQNFHVSPTCSPTRAMLMSGTDNHLAGLGTMAETASALHKGKPGYEGVLSPDIVAFPELLQQAGYRTLMAGKWHLGKTEGQGPAARGFDRSFALLGGGATFFDQRAGPGPEAQSSNMASYREDGKPVTLPRDGNFYLTDFLTSKLIDYIAEGNTVPVRERKPFFAYAALTAPHFPLQAPDALIEKYEGVYDKGYERIRAQRIDRLMKLGLLERRAHVAPPQPSWPRWAQLDARQRAIEARKMAVYAAMVESVDRNIGRLVGYLKASGQFDNTVFVFLSDNGPEGNDVHDIVPLAVVRSGADNRLENIGRRGSYVGYGPGWGQVSATPFKMFKSFTAEGGVRSPAIVSYPAMTARAGGVSKVLASVKDLAPTFLDLAGVQPSRTDARGRAVQAMQGKSMWPYLSGRADSVHAHDAVMGMELFGRTTLRQGDWKLSFDNKPWSDGGWALYNLRADPAERRNLAAKQPRKTAELRALWNNWAAENNVLFNEEEAGKPKYTNTRRYYETLASEMP